MTGAVTTGLVCTPLLAEWLAVRRVRAPVVRTGAGPGGRVPATAAHTRSAVTTTPGGSSGTSGSQGPAAYRPLLVAGVAGALTDDLSAGDLVVSDELRTRGAHLPCHAAPLVAAALGRQGVSVRLGPVHSCARVLHGSKQRRAVDRQMPTRSLTVDTESAFLAARAPAGQTVAVRAVVDTPSAPLRRPGTAWRGLAALRALRAAGPVLDAWAAATGEREVLLAAPGSPCAAGDAPPTVRAVAHQSDLVLVLGPADAPDCRRLAEAARPEGTRWHLVGDVTDVDLRWLAGVRRVGIVVGAPDVSHRVDDLVRALSGLGTVRVRQAQVVHEDARFTLLQEVS